MRGAFVRALVNLASGDPRILLLTGDLGYSVLEPFAEKFPERFFNMGVAEQNMIGVATGLAEAGFIPFCYSIATFASMRGYEFLRSGAILHQFPVRIVGVGGGFEYGTAGATHHGLEDVGILRVQPGLTLIAPADHEQAYSAIAQTWDLPGPVYYRLGKDDRTTIPGLDGQFDLGHAQLIRSGNDLLFVVMGSIAAEVVAAAETLAKQGIEAAVLVVASLTPAPVSDLIKVLSQFPLVLTVEAHYCVGGVGSLVAEVAAEAGLPCRVVRCGVRTSPEGVTGSQRYMEHVHGLSSDRLVATALEVLKPMQASHS